MDVNVQRRTAKDNYRTPCPGCGRKIRKGDGVTPAPRIGGGNNWYHSACYAAKTAAAKILSPDGDTFRARYKGS